MICVENSKDIMTNYNSSYLTRNTAITSLSVNPGTKVSILLVIDLALCYVDAIDIFTKLRLSREN